MQWQITVTISPSNSTPSSNFPTQNNNSYCINCLASGVASQKLRELVMRTAISGAQIPRPPVSPKTAIPLLLAAGFKTSLQSVHNISRQYAIQFQISILKMTVYWLYLSIFLRSSKNKYRNPCEICWKFFYDWLLRQCRICWCGFCKTCNRAIQELQKDCWNCEGQSIGERLKIECSEQVNYWIFLNDYYIYNIRVKTSYYYNSALFKMIVKWNAKNRSIYLDSKPYNQDQLVDCKYYQVNLHIIILHALKNDRVLIKRNIGSRLAQPQTTIRKDSGIQNNEQAEIFILGVWLSIVGIIVAISCLQIGSDYGLANPQLKKNLLQFIFLCSAIMITASHNPASDNGIKIGYTCGNVLQQQENKKIKHLLNDDQDFKQFVQSKLSQLNKSSQNLPDICFIGRDARTSSPWISSLVCNTLKMIKIVPIDLEICSTPQLFSLSQQILNQHSISQIKQLKIVQAKQKYVKQVMKYFKYCYQKLTDHKMPKVLMDFSNGSGAVSYLLYKNEFQKWFHVTQICNKQFDLTNFKCGAEYFYRNWNLVLESPQFQNYDECFLFDGDSDRIVVYVSGSQKPFDGNSFSIFLIRMLKKIFTTLMEDQQFKESFNLKDFGLNLIGTTFSNLGVKIQAKKLEVNSYATDIGTVNIFRRPVELQQISVFFEPNGHGGIYFPQKVIKKVEILLQKSPDSLQLNLLLSLHKILKNNSRGYGLHNMLVYYLCKNYLKLPPQQFNNLYPQVFQIMKDLKIRYPNYQLFKNGIQRNNQLTQPEHLLLKINKICEKYNQYECNIRKSATTKDTVRISVQGLEESVCHQFCDELVEAIREDGHLDHDQIV